MSDHPLDHPAILSTLFYPRRDTPGKSRLPHTHDGTVSVEDNIVVGYRLYLHEPESPLILYFHGNGEVASDYDGIAPMYHQIGASLLVVDYRGYGWSTGTPLTSKMNTDAEKVLLALPAILNEQGVKPSALFVKGRSLGSAPAVYLAMVRPDSFQGVIIESGYADAPSLFQRLGLPVPTDLPDVDMLPISNHDKMKRVHLPLLVIHGENDTLLPVEHGQSLYDASPSEHKRILRIPNAGHNDLLFVGQRDYFESVAQFLQAYS